MKFCNQCGQGNEDDAEFCIQCGVKLAAEGEAPVAPPGGAPPPPPGVAVPPPPGAGPPPVPDYTAPAQQPTGFPPPPGIPIARPKPNDGSAVASLVMGIASFFTCWLILGVLAVVFGYIGKRNIEDSGGALGGEAFAVAGIILGWINIAIVAIVAIIILAVRV